LKEVTAQMIHDASIRQKNGMATEADEELLSYLNPAEITCAIEMTQQEQGDLTLNDIREAIYGVFTAHLHAPTVEAEPSVRFDYSGGTMATVQITLPHQTSPDVTINLYSERYGAQHHPPLVEIGWYSGSAKSPMQAGRMAKALEAAAEIASNPQDAWDIAVAQYEARKAAR
jgi:hypothetical protein